MAELLDFATATLEELLDAVIPADDLEGLIVCNPPFTANQAHFVPVVRKRLLSALDLQRDIEAADAPDRYHELRGVFDEEMELVS